MFMYASIQNTSTTKYPWVPDVSHTFYYKKNTLWIINSKYPLKNISLENYMFWSILTLIKGENCVSNCPLYQFGHQTWIKVPGWLVSQKINMRPHLCLFPGFTYKGTDTAKLKSAPTVLTANQHWRWLSNEILWILVLAKLSAIKVEGLEILQFWDPTKLADIGK